MSWFGCRILESGNPGVSVAFFLSELPQVAGRGDGPMGKGGEELFMGKV